jgi:hypothetical protein
MNLKLQLGIFFQKYFTFTADYKYKIVDFIANEFNVEKDT